MLWSLGHAAGHPTRCVQQPALPLSPLYCCWGAQQHVVYGAVYSASLHPCVLAIIGAPIEPSVGAQEATDVSAICVHSRWHVQVAVFTVCPFCPSSAQPAG